MNAIEPSPAELPLAPRWLHAWALLTVAATAGLLALGGMVTTFRVGMADPVWPTAPWYLFFISWREPSAGFLIEHSHRLAGYVVGCCTIVLAVGLGLGARRPWLRWLGLAALLGVIAQGVLGGFRVRLNALLGTDLASLHGCFAQVVFCLLTSLALFTSPRFPQAALPREEGRRLRRLALLLTFLAFCQLLWGALLRHTPGSVPPRLHLLTAFAVVAAAVLLARAAWEGAAGRRVLRAPLIVLGVLLVVQISLGVEAWMGKFAGVELPEMQTVTVVQAAVRTTHVVVGAWVLAGAVVLTLLAYRPSREEIAAGPGLTSELRESLAVGSLFRPAAGVSSINCAAGQREGTA